MNSAIHYFTRDLVRTKGTLGPAFHYEAVDVKNKVLPFLDHLGPDRIIAVMPWGPDGIAVLYWEEGCLADTEPDKHVQAARKIAARVKYKGNTVQRIEALERREKHLTSRIQDLVQALGSASNWMKGENVASELEDLHDRLCKVEGVDTFDQQTVQERLANLEKKML